MNNFQRKTVTYLVERVRRPESLRRVVQNNQPIMAERETLMTTTKVQPQETEHQKVFRLVGERRFEEAARIAARLINLQDDEGFFIYGHTTNYRRAEDWFRNQVSVARSSVAANVHSITPEIAQVLLLNNDGNRRVDPGALAVYMRDITSGAWIVNGETIKISRDGKLNDGQHRLFSVLLTGSPIKSLVAPGLTRESMFTVDDGKKRTNADRFSLRGEGDPNTTAAIAALAFEIYEGRKPTSSEVTDYYAVNRDKILLANSVKGANIRGIGPSPAGVAALHLIQSGFKSEDVRKFIASVRTGEMIGRGHPAFALRKALFPTSGKEPPLRLSRPQSVATLVQHFVAWKNGRKLFEPMKNATLPEVA